MHEDPEFEKQIRQRMEELKFSPSKTVWDNLEKEITKDKRRRRPLLWLSFFLAIGLAGTFYFVRNTGDGHNNNISGKPDAANVSSEKDKSHENTSNDKNATLTEKNDSKVETKTNSLNPDGKTDKFKEAKSSRNIVATDKHSGKKIDQKNTNEPAADFLAVSKLSKGKKISGNGTHQNTKNPADELIKNEIVTNELEANAEKHSYLNDAQKADNKNEVAAAVAPQAENNAQKKSSPDKVIEDKSGSKKDVAQNKKSQTKKPWEFGFTGGAGISSVNENLFKTATGVTNANAYTQSFSLAAAPAPPLYNAPSSFKAGFSFSAGILLQKGIGKRFIFSTGLNYHYSSTKLSTTAYGYYGAGQTQSYTNRYHLVELPVSLSYQFNKSQRFPLFVEAGLSLAELVGSDAMHYNSTTGTYFKNNKLFNKTQLNAATAVMIGLHPYKHLYFQVGPQVQYGITNLLTADASGSQHLFFGGIKIIFIPNKK